MKPTRNWYLAPGCSSSRSEEHTSELQSRLHLVCRLLLEKKKTPTYTPAPRPSLLACVAFGAASVPTPVLSNYAQPAPRAAPTVRSLPAPQRTIQAALATAMS